MSCVREVQWEAERWCGVKPEVTETVKALYDGACGRYETAYGLTDKFDLRRGNIQGCSQSPGRTRRWPACWTPPEDATTEWTQDHSAHTPPRYRRHPPCHPPAAPSLSRATQGSNQPGTASPPPLQDRLDSCGRARRRARRRGCGHCYHPTAEPVCGGTRGRSGSWNRGRAGVPEARECRPGCRVKSSQVDRTVPSVGLSTRGIRPRRGSSQPSAGGTCHVCRVTRVSALTSCPRYSRSQDHRKRDTRKRLDGEGQRRWPYARTCSPTSTLT